MRVLVCLVSACLLSAIALSAVHGEDSLPLATLLDSHSDTGLQEPAPPLFSGAGLLTSYFAPSASELPLVDIKAPPCCGTCDSYMTIEALLLFRTSTASEPAIVLNTAGDVLVGASDLQSLAFGGRFTWGFPRVCGSQWEFSYFAVAPSLGSLTVVSENDLRIPDPLGSQTLNFLFADQMIVDYTSTIQSAEFNYISQPLGIGAWKIIGGVRYLHVDENFNLHTFDSDTGESNYHLETVNNLVGAQMGIRWSGAGPVLDYNLQGKFGGYANFSGQSQTIDDFPPGYILRDQSAMKSSGAFVGDLSFGATRHFGKRWHLHGGYNLMLLTGIAAASNQLDFSDTVDSGRAVNPRGTILLHGFSAGIEARW